MEEIESMFLAKIDFDFGEKFTIISSFLDSTYEDANIEYCRFRA